MTSLHGTIAGTKIDAMRVSLKKKLTSISDIPSYFVAFSAGIARLVTAGRQESGNSGIRVFYDTFQSEN
jgi:hypothetical protein